MSLSCFTFAHFPFPPDVEAQKEMIKIHFFLLLIWQINIWKWFSIPTSKFAVSNFSFSFPFSHYLFRSLFFFTRQKVDFYFIFAFTATSLRSTDVQNEIDFCSIRNLSSSSSPPPTPSYIYLFSFFRNIIIMYVEIFSYFSKCMLYGFLIVCIWYCKHIEIGEMEK